MDAANCPICGIVVYGDGPNDLGYNLGEHMREMHGNERNN